MRVLDDLKGHHGRHYTPGHCSHPFSTRTMQHNSSLLYPYTQKNSSSQHPASANDDSAPSAVVTSTPTHTPVFAGPHQWPSAVVPVIRNDDGPPTDATESTRRAAYAPLHQIAWNSTLHVLPAAHPGRHSTDTLLEPWLSAATTRTYAPPMWPSVASTQPNRSQVPSGTTDPNILRRTRSHQSNNYRAVEAPAQPLSQRYPSYQMPTYHEAGTSYLSTSQVPTTSFGGVSSWTPQSTPIQVPSLSRRRRYARRVHARPESVICDKCQKSMRPQSLKRHVREVHDRIKRH